MAKIWPVYEGMQPTAGGPWAHLPVSEAVALFDLRPDDHVSDSATTPRFGDVDRDLTHFGYKHIVVEIEPGEGRKAKWKPGFYRSRITPDQTFTKLLQHAVVHELGEDNFVDLTVGPTADSQGRQALRITVVIAPNAIQQLDGDKVLSALVKVRERLNQMGDERTPIVEYATEAELDVAPEP